MGNVSFNISHIISINLQPLKYNQHFHYEITLYQTYMLYVITCLILKNVLVNLMQHSLIYHATYGKRL